MCQGPAEGGTAALEYLLCSLELRIMGVDLADPLQGPAAELFQDAARRRERVHMSQSAASAACLESGACRGGVRVLAERETDGEMADLHGPPVASPAQPARP